MVDREVGGRVIGTGVKGAVSERMKYAWDDRAKLNTWLQVEQAACYAWSWEEDLFTKKDLGEIMGATWSEITFQSALTRTRHEMTAFLESIECEEKAKRWIHYGLTSSDVMDTALAIQCVRALSLLITNIPKELSNYTYVLNGALNNVAIGKFSGAVGTHATVPPTVEKRACEYLGLDVCTITSQIIPRDIHARVIVALALVAATARRTVGEHPAIQGRGLVIQSYVVPALENVALWGERDLSHSSSERIVFPHTFQLLAEIWDILNGYGNHL